MQKLNSFYWHDGLLEDVHFSVGKNSSHILLKVQVYAGSEAPHRKGFELRFTGVTSCVFSCDVNELMDNLSAGNISNGYAKDLKQEEGLFVYRMYLSDGYVEIVSKSVEVREI